MKKKFLNAFILTVFMLTDFVAFAQNPGDDDDDTGLEGNDADPVPINGKLMWLAILGIIFAVYTYRNYCNNKKEA